MTVLEIVALVVLILALASCPTYFYIKAKREEKDNKKKSLQIAVMLTANDVLRGHRTKWRANHTEVRELAEKLSDLENKIDKILAEKKYTPKKLWDASYEPTLHNLRLEWAKTKGLRADAIRAEEKARAGFDAERARLGIEWDFLLWEWENGFIN